MLHSSLSYVLANDPRELDLTFEAMHGATAIELIPNGANVPVTDDNKEVYVRKLLEFHFVTGREKQIESVLEGFNSFISRSLLSELAPKQLELLLCGLSLIDVADWKGNTSYENGYSSTSPQVMWFWETVESFDQPMRAKLLQFVTGTSRVPAAGFANLEGAAGPCRFSVYQYQQLPALPRGHTCFNRLDLPAYKSLDDVCCRAVFVNRTDVVI